MRVRNRVENLERRVGSAEDVVMPVVWRGPHDERAYARFEEAQRRGFRVKLIVISEAHDAKNHDEAMKIIAERRAAGSQRHIVVHGPDRGPDGRREVLARDGELPSFDW